MSTKQAICVRPIGRTSLTALRHDASPGVASDPGSGVASDPGSGVDLYPGSLAHPRGRIRPSYLYFGPDLLVRAPCDWADFRSLGEDKGSRAKGTAISDWRPLRHNMDIIRRARRSAPPMPCTIIPFPLSRRRAFVRRHARLSPAAADRHLATQLRIQSSALLRKGIDAETVKSERASLAAAVHAELVRIGAARGGVA